MQPDKLDLIYRALAASADTLTDPDPDPDPDPGDGHTSFEHGAPPGAVTIYSRQPCVFDDVAKTIAGGFAMQAAIVVYGAERVAHLESALQSRDVIGQAKGILMQRDGVDAAAAFAKLVRASQDTNMKLVDVARWLTDEVARSAPARRPQGPRHDEPRSCLHVHTEADDDA